MGMQVTGKADFIAQYLESGDYHGSCVADDGCFLCDLV